jgi:hypothetical protein
VLDFLMGLVVSAAIVLVVLHVRRYDVRSHERPCSHCWHWLLTTRAGTVVHEQCCRCGRMRSTYVTAETSAARTLEHGEYVQFRSDRDRWTA